MGHGPRALGHGPWAMGHGPWALGLGPWAMGLGPWAMGHGPSIPRLYFKPLASGSSGSFFVRYYFQLPCMQIQIPEVSQTDES